MAGRTLAELGLTRDLTVDGVFVKTPVFPFIRFPGVDTILGPEMKSTGEVMGGASTFGEAFAKAYLSVGQELPASGTVFISVNNDDKPNVLATARRACVAWIPTGRYAWDGRVSAGARRGMPPRCSRSTRGVPTWPIRW